MMRGWLSRRTGRFIYTFSLSFLVTLLITGAYVFNKSRMEYAQKEQFVQEKADNIRSVITSLLFKTQVLSALVIQNNGQIRDFERVAATVLDDPAIRNVIMAPDGVVSNVYPLEGNEEVLGLDYFSNSEGNKEAIQAKESGQLVLGGPFNLVQGGQALVGRLPVFINDENGERRFWGLVSVTLNYPQALERAELHRLKDKGISFEVWRISPDTGQKQVIARSDNDISPTARYLEEPITILNAQWFFRISPVRYWYEFSETWIFTVLGLCISLLISQLVVHNYDLGRIKRELETLTYTDPLTGILNRRGIFKVMEEWMEQPGNGFVLCYIDLNKFKNINDQYGHVCGDYVLKKLSETFISRMDKRYAFGRIGGDEFVLIAKSMGDGGELAEFLETVRGDLERPIILESKKEIRVVFSIGQARYPQDGHTADELLAYADEVMYREKEAGCSS